MSERIYGIQTPIRLDYTYAPGAATMRFLPAGTEPGIGLIAGATERVRRPLCHAVGGA